MADFTWEKAVILQVSAKDWLEVHGLAAQGLTMDQILRTLGFQQKRGHVSALKRSVASQYAAGLFTQHPASNGQVYNLCAVSPEKLQLVEEQLLQMVAKLKARLEWLNTKSRLQFGVVKGKRVVMVIDSCSTEHAQLQSFLRVASNVIREQFINTQRFNVIRCTDGVESWGEGLSESTLENVGEAAQWVEQTPSQAPQLHSSVVEAVNLALTHTEADEVYLLTHGDASLTAYDQLLEKKVGGSPVPVHVVAFGCHSTTALEQYKQLANISNGRCHAYTPPTHTLHSTSYHSLPSIRSPSHLTKKRPGSGQSQPSSSSPTLPREDVLLVWAELERTRDTLAEVQALRLEVGGATLEASAPYQTQYSEDYITSAQWLKTHGIHGRKLMFGDLVSSLAFRHCSGVVDLPTGKKNELQLIPHNVVVHAKYCKDFVHIRWKDNQVVHVQLSKRAFGEYERRVKSVMAECEERIAWLKSGSRVLFGTILEKKVVIVIDTSTSIRDRLDLIKDKIHQLIEEQLSQKEEFTMIQFSSRVGPWREHLVPTTDHNLQAVWRWVQGLRADGSTNTMDALTHAMSIREAEAVYLLTDGRPDQPTEAILAWVQQLPSVPVHTISFNCADSKANYFLSQLASNTGGRYYFYSEDMSDPDGPKSCESEDLKRLEVEMSLAEEQLSRAGELWEECRMMAGRGREKGSPSKVTAEEESVSTEDMEIEKKKPRGMMSSKTWLATNGLSAKHLTLMDALGPTAVTHSPKHIPLLDRHVASRVFDSILPLAHITSNSKVTLINPNGVDLNGYEDKLEKQVALYQRRLSRLAWEAIPTDQKEEVTRECGGGDSELPSYRDHRDVLRRVLSELDWPRSQEDFDLLEQEVALGESYLRYSTALREEANTLREETHHSLDQEVETTTTRDRYQSGMSGSSLRSSGGSLAALMSELQLHTSPSPVDRRRGDGDSRRGKRAAVRVRGGRVLARSNIDGFYYPAAVLGTDRHHAVVQFADRRQQTTHPSHVVPVGGAGPCPALHLGDHVLVRVRSKGGGLHPTSDGSCDYYIPGTVQVLPSNPRRGHALHSISVFNSMSITSARRGIVKISESRYSRACEFIQSKRAEEGEGAQSDEGQKSQVSHEEMESQVSDEEQKSQTSIPSGEQSNRESPLQIVDSHSTGHDKPNHHRHDEPNHHRHDEPDHHRQGGDEVDEGTTGEGGGTGGKEEILSVLGHQSEQLGEHQSAIAALQEQQKHLEEQLAHTKTEDTEAAPDLTSAPESHHLTSAPELEVEVLDCCDQGVNTDPCFEDRGVGTGPWMESQCVGTEWSESSDDETVSRHTSPLHTSTPQPSPQNEVTMADPSFSPSHSTMHPSHLHSLDPLIGQQVLAKWPDDGWYYRGLVAQSVEGGRRYVVTDASGDSETIHVTDIITDLQDAQLPLSLGDTVVAVHPDYDYSYAPGHVATIAADGFHFTVDLYDETQAQLLPRHMVYRLSKEKHDRDVKYLLEMERAWVGQAVIARKDKDGFYYPGKVIKQLSHSQYEVHWVDQTAQAQEAVHIFGPLTKRRPLRTGDHVLALADTKRALCMPGEICGVQGGKITVEFCDEERDHVEASQCFWISDDYYQMAVEYLCSTLTPSVSEVSMDTTTTGGYTPSYPE